MDADSKCMEQDPSTQLRTGDSEQDADFDSKVSSPSIVDSPPFSKLSITEGKNGTAHLKNGLGASSEPYHDAEPVKKLRCLCRFKMIYVICVVVVAVWGLLSLPIIFYHLPEHKESPTTNGECSASFPYPTAGGVCRAELEGILLSMECDSGGTPLVLRDEESTARQLTAGFSFLNPSPVCEEAVVPFLCLFLFGLCDSSGVSLQPTSGQCGHLRDGVCSTEWSTALSFGVDLPDCNSFPTEQVSCPVQSGSGSGASGENSARMSSGVSMENITVPLENRTDPLQCRDGFYRTSRDSICLPSCYSWKQYPKAVSIAIDVIVFITAFVGFVAAIAVIIISLLRRKRMFVFPSVFVVYETVDLLVLAFFVMVSYFDRPSLFCASKNIVDTEAKVTPFCVISGMVFTYILMQLAVLWLFHTVALFWKVAFPFHARSFDVTRRTKYIHIACVIAGILIPLIPIIASVATSAVDFKSGPSTNISFLDGGLGFRVTRFPPILCTGSDRDVVFYSVVLPLDISLTIGCSLLIIMFWIIHKQNGLFRSNDSNSKNLFKIGTAERKLLIVFCYYVLLAAIALTTFTLSIKDTSEITEHLINYFSCERDGHNSSNPCSRSELEALNNPTLTTLSYVLLGLFPVVNLVYAVNIDELKVYLQCLRKKSKFSNSNDFSTASSAVNSFTLKRM